MTQDIKPAKRSPANAPDVSERLASNPLRIEASRWPLPTKIILALAFALLPLGILAFIVATDAYKDLRTGQIELARSEVVALRRATEAVFDEDFSMLQATLFDDANTPEQRVACDRLLSGIAQFDLQIASLVRIDPAGRLLCASAGARLPSSTVIAEARRISPQTPLRFIRMLLLDPASGDLVMIVRDNGARASGNTVLARIPHEIFGKFIDESMRAPDDAIQLKLRGRLLATWGKQPALALLDPARSPLNFNAGIARVSAGGRMWLVGKTSLVASSLELTLVTPASELSTVQALGVALPALMWLAALAISWVAISRLVVDPLGTLRRSIERYAAGDETVRFGEHAFSTAEMQSLGLAFDGMADQIRNHEGDLRSALATQKKLTREVHHRVKNNLQIVSSLLSIQSRDALNIEVAHAYTMIQQRVNALALVHRWLFDDEAMHGVDLRSLTQDLCAGLEHSIAGSENRSVSIIPDVERIYVSQDTAVPLAFLITEFITAAARLAHNAPLDLSITAYAKDDRARLSIQAALFGANNIFEVGSTDPSARIVQGMIRQMRSTLIYDGALGRYSIEFPLAPTSRPVSED